MRKIRKNSNEWKALIKSSGWESNEIGHLNVPVIGDLTNANIQTLVEKDGEYVASGTGRYTYKKTVFVETETEQTVVTAVDEDELNRIQHGIKLSNMDGNMYSVIEKLKIEPKVFSDPLIEIIDGINNVAYNVVDLILAIIVNDDPAILRIFDGYSDEELKALMDALRNKIKFPIIVENIKKTYDASIARKQFSMGYLNQFLTGESYAPQTENFDVLEVVAKMTNNGAESSKYVEYNDIIDTRTNNKIGLKTVYYFDGVATATWYSTEEYGNGNPLYKTLSEFYDSLVLSGLIQATNFVDANDDTNTTNEIKVGGFLEKLYSLSGRLQTMTTIKKVAEIDEESFYVDVIDTNTENNDVIGVAILDGNGGFKFHTTYGIATYESLEDMEEAIFRKSDAIVEDVVKDDKEKSFDELAHDIATFAEWTGEDIVSIFIEALQNTTDEKIVDYMLPSIENEIEVYLNDAILNAKGVEVAKILNYSVVGIMEVFCLALEDANFHSESKTLRQVYASFNMIDEDSDVNEVETSPKGLYEVYGSWGNGGDGQKLQSIVDTRTVSAVGSKETFEDGTIIYFTTVDGENDKQFDMLGDFENYMISLSFNFDENGRELSTSKILAVDPNFEKQHLTSYSLDILDTRVADKIVGKCMVMLDLSRKYEDLAGNRFNTLDELEAHLLIDVVAQTIVDETETFETLIVSGESTDNNHAGGEFIRYNEIVDSSIDEVVGYKMRSYTVLGNIINTWYGVTKDTVFGDGVYTTLDGFYTYLMEYAETSNLNLDENGVELSTSGNFSVASYFDAGKEAPYILAILNNRQITVGECFVFEDLSRSYEDYGKHVFKTLDEFELHFSTNIEEGSEINRMYSTTQRLTTTETITKVNENGSHYVDILDTETNTVVGYVFFEDGGFVYETLNGEFSSNSLDALETFLYGNTSTEVQPLEEIAFEIGDLVYNKSQENYGIILNNYGNNLDGDGDEVRLDSDGNQYIHTYDSAWKNNGYNLVHYVPNSGMEVPDFESMKNSAKNLISSNSDVDMVAYYETAYKRLLSGEFDGEVSMFLSKNVLFEIGDLVYNKSQENYGIILNNYGNNLNGESGEVRLDSDGNQSIFTYDSDWENNGYNLVHYVHNSGMEVPDLKTMKHSAKYLISSRLENKDMESVAYYETAYKRLLSGEFDGEVVQDVPTQTATGKVIYNPNDTRVYIPTAEKVTVENYPYGRLRATLYHSVEFAYKKGYRVVTQTINPKTNRLNAPKKSTYYDVIVRYYNEDSHIKARHFSLNGREEINKLSEFVNQHFELFTSEEVEAIYAKMLVGCKIDMQATAVYGGSKVEDLTPLYRKTVDTCVAGIKTKGVENLFDDIYLDEALIDATKPENYQPFKMSSH